VADTSHGLCEDFSEDETAFREASRCINLLSPNREAKLQLLPLHRSDHR